jgi:hypothetical protein
MLANITNYKNIGDWFFLVTAALVIDLIVILLAKYPGQKTYFKINSLDDWYAKFGLAAVGADVLSLVLCIMFARYIFAGLNLTNPMYFIPVLLLFQMVHDIFFYVAVITPIPEGHNKMIDVFKSYGKENGALILGADALMVLFSVLLGSILKSLPEHYTASTALITLYSICYIIYTRKPLKN